MSQVVIGVDTGKKGGIAICVDGKLAAAAPMPDGHPGVFIEAMACRLGVAVTLVYEKPNGFMGKTASYWAGFYESAMLSLARCFKVECVLPKEWQKEMFATVRKVDDTKANARSALQNLAPEFAATINMKHDGIVDACLIALYGARKDGAK